MLFGHLTHVFFPPRPKGTTRTIIVLFVGGETCYKPIVDLFLASASTQQGVLMGNNWFNSLGHGRLEDTIWFGPLTVFSSSFGPVTLGSTSFGVLG